MLFDDEGSRKAGTTILSTTIDEFDDFGRCSDYVRSIEIPGAVMCIDATDFSYQCSEEILAEIDAFMRDNP